MPVPTGLHQSIWYKPLDLSNVLSLYLPDCISPFALQTYTIYIHPTGLHQSICYLRI